MEFALMERLLLAILIAVSTGVFARDLSRKIRLILPGRRERTRTDHLLTRAGRVLREVLFQARVVGGRPIAGGMHAAVFFGFLFFGFETTDHFLEAFDLHFLDTILGGGVPLFKLIVAGWAIIVSVAIVGLAFRRFVLVKYSPDPKSYSSGVVALLILLLMLTYLFGLTEPDPVLAKVNWWAHALMILVFPWLILRSKHFHLLIAPANIFLRTLRLGQLQTMNLDLEALEHSKEDLTLGLENIAAFGWKQRMDFLSCVECRRCTDQCPAHQSGQELDPRGFVLAGRHAIETFPGEDPVIGPVISETALGQCTTCGACEAICPCGIEHLQLLTGAKRAQALATGTGMVASDFLNEVERSGNAFGRPRSQRAQLIEELQIPIFETTSSKYLLWLGCVWSYNPDAKSAVKAMVTVLEAAGVSYGVLAKEPCCGHHSRRQGEEMQFQTLAAETIASLQSVGAERVITACPHCLHTLGREYPEFDESFSCKITHHAQFLSHLVDEGAIAIEPTQDDSKTATYHDPCYLGRYEGEFDTARRLAAKAGIQIVEMAKSHARATCCGGGSAGFVREQEVEQRMDQLRARQVRETGATTLITACPECKMMLDPATEATRDIAEIVAQALQKPVA